MLYLSMKLAVLFSLVSVALSQAQLRSPFENSAPEVPTPEAPAAEVPAAADNESPLVETRKIRHGELKNVLAKVPKSPFETAKGVKAGHSGSPISPFQLPKTQKMRHGEVEELMKIKDSDSPFAQGDPMGVVGKGAPLEFNGPELVTQKAEPLPRRGRSSRSPSPKGGRGRSRGRLNRRSKL